MKTLFHCPKKSAVVAIGQKSPNGMTQAVAANILLPFVRLALKQNQIIGSRKLPILVDGYFQEKLSKSEFDIITNAVRSCLKTSLKNKLEKSDKDTLVVHLRGGDFVRTGRNPSLTKEFYIEAIGLIASKVKLKRVLVVTDDLAWAKKTLHNCSHKLVFQSSDAQTDFLSIARCEYRILSPSTFSLWASVLGFNPESGIVVGWKYWRGNVKREFLLENEVSLRL